MKSTPGSPSHHRLAITVRGVVQGVGFRPFVFQTAQRLGLSGWVRNEADVVRIEVQGLQAATRAFVEMLRNEPPPQARVDAVNAEEIPPVACDEGFAIRPSGGDAAPQPTIPVDLAVCPACLAEIRDPGERRYGYPFTNCTNCGPRWSIIERLPYDRRQTSMARFTMCADCRAEFENPADRRFHAQPIACPRCGPALELLDRQSHRLATGLAALDDAARAILAGRIVALKGLGGFQLLADATNSEAVALLRHRKRRPDRPFALMMATLEDVRRYCRVSDEEAQVLGSHRAPIVLLGVISEERRASPPAQGDPNGTLSPLLSPLSSLPSPLSPLIAPGNPQLGVMLPYTPLHHLLTAAVGRPIVCTSGNLSEEPMAITIDDALARLGPIADVFLTHDRPIVRPVDDSIVRVRSDGVQILRRARGFAPLPIEIRNEDGVSPTVLALGGHLKNAVALSLAKTSGDKSAKVVMSAHVGDLDSLASVEVFHRAADDLLEFFRVAPDVVACDLHPDYASTRYAEQLALQWQVPLVRVQHHHAHVAACMAEHGLQGPVLGFAWDGTGYGTDHTVWGGETLWCEGATFRRAATLRTFRLPGGDRATREPRRSALGLLFEMLGPQAAELATAWFQKSELDALASMLSREFHSPRTSSMGRLFDAVAALCGLPPVISFEGQAAMALEYAADESERESYPMTLSMAGGPDSRQPEAILVADWEPMVRAVLADRAAGVPVGRISARFHNALAEMAVAIARSAAPASGCVVLSGGCFQNALLAARIDAALSAAGFRVYNPREVPPGDGGIALGQVFVALQHHQGTP